VVDTCRAEQLGKAKAGCLGKKPRQKPTERRVRRKRSSRVIGTERLW